jgi:hypothetical protein
MRTLLRLAARLYPAAWRARYGAEFAALLEDLRPGWRDLADVGRGGIQMLFFSSRGLRRAACLGVLGALLAFAVTYALPHRYRGNATFSLGPMDRATATKLANERFVAATRRSTLTGVIVNHNLYSAQRARLPFEDVVEVMRQDIRLTAEHDGGFNLSFTYTDPDTAAAVTQHLLREMAPGAAGARMMSSLPVTPHRFAFVLAGLSGGVMIGALSLIRWRRRAA